MKQIRILHLVGSMKQRYGITSILMNLYRGLDKKNIQFDFLIQDDTDESIIEEINQLGGRVFFMPNLCIKSMNSFKNYMKVFFRENRGKYEIIHSHFNQIELIVFPIAKKNGIKVCISHSHNTKYSDYRLRAIRNYIMCLPLRRNATHYFACSKDAGEFLFGKESVKNNEVTIIRNAIDYKKFEYNEKTREEIRKKFKIGNEIVFGNVGSFKKQKNHQFLIDIFYEISKINENVKLILVGDGELRDELIDRVKRYGLCEKVIFAGVSDCVYKFYQAFDAFIFPSLYEGFGMVLLEAQVSGLPIIASDVIPEEVRVSKFSKYLSTSSIAKEWAIESLSMVNEIERKELEKIGKYMQYNSIDEAQRLASIYRKLINEKVF